MKNQKNVTVEVSDKGCGISDDILTGIQRGAVGPGMGIAGMRERLRQLGGNLVLESIRAARRLKRTCRWEDHWRFRLNQRDGDEPAKFEECLHWHWAH